jgi:hypothetical protein
MLTSDEIPLKCEPNAKIITIPASMTELTANSFDSPESVEAIKFEHGSRIRVLGEGAFGFLQSLKSICIPASVEVLGSHCFVDLYVEEPFSPVESITFESGSRLSELQGWTFSGCMSLKSICLPASVQTLTGQNFAGSGLTQIGFDAANEYYHSIGDYVMDKRKPKLIRYFGPGSEIRIEDDVEEIGPYAFCFCSWILSVGFGRMSKLSCIGRCAFQTCSNLESISIPVSVEVVCEYCFWTCKSLVSVSFSSGSKLRVMENHVFAGCTALKSIAIPSSAEVLEQGSFISCETLDTITFPPDSKLTRLGTGAFCGCRSLTSILLPSSVVHVGGRCFRECYALSSLTFSSPCNVETLLDLPPYSPTEIAIPDTVCELGFLSWAGCPGNFTLTFGRDSKLSHIGPSSDPGFHFVRCFLRVSTNSLKVLRGLMEFGLDAVP